VFDCLQAGILTTDSPSAIGLWRAAVASTSGSETVQPCRSSGVNTTVPHPARVYDYWLGGKDNYEADRRAAAEAIEIFPKTVQSARS
jgi:hypothetical protein